MLCAYCGHQTANVPSASPTDSFELQSPNLSFQTCNHQSDLQRLKETDYPLYLQTLFNMVGQQISSIEEIEAILEKKKAALVFRVKEFVEVNTPKLNGCAQAVLSFNNNWSNLQIITVPEPYTAWINPDLTSYFDKQKLVGWSDRCISHTFKIQKKIQSFEKEFFPEFLKQLEADGQALDDACKSLQSRFEIHRRLLDTHEMTQTHNTHHQKTIEDIFEKLNSDAKGFIKDKSDKLNSLLKKTNTKLTQSIFLMTENVTELANDVKIMTVFEQMEAIVASCIEEMTRRANFETVYHRLMSLTNQLAQKENEKRTVFVATWGEKIPSQMFPDIRQQVKLINEDIFFKEGLASKVGKSLLGSEQTSKLEGAAETVMGLV